MISVGNLTLGGSGKTPIVAHVAQVLLELGERPAVLSRGYGRAVISDGVVVVRDAERMHADLDRAGDEPLMLARRLNGVAVLVSTDRALAGKIAETHLGCTVHVLDDGFQHLGLWRDVDLLVVPPRDLEETPARLREPFDMAAAADAVLVEGDGDRTTQSVADRLGIGRAFRISRSLGEPLGLDAKPVAIADHTPVLAFAGVARPDRFFALLGAHGYRVRDTIAFRDHHRYTSADLSRIAASVSRAGAELAVTTEKDAVRLLWARPLPLKLAWVPLKTSVEPRAEFREWLQGQLADARARAKAVA